MLCGFLNDSWLVIALLVMLAVHLSTDTLALLTLNWSSIFVKVVILIRFIGFRDPFFLVVFGLFMNCFT